jgi:serine protease Do
MATMNKERMRSMLGSGLGLGLVGVLVLGVGVLIGWNASGSAVNAAAPPVVAAQPAQVAQPGATVQRRATDSYADLVAQVAPAVVTIQAERVVKPTAMPFGDDSFFEQFFGRQGRQAPMRPREEGALGSGVIVSQDGYILTNHHVIDGASKIRVELTDRQSYDAKVVGSDPPSDLAVLKIQATNLHALPLGDSEKVRVGDVVLAIGNPLGVGQTVTMGIISAKGRATGLSDGAYEDFLQTDAPINQGNSGGPLIDTRGELVGINSQILTPSGGSIGIGFAIPAAMAQNVMQQLIKNGVVRRAMIGVTVQGVTSDLAKSLGLTDVRGALVSEVQPDGPAQKADIERGDVILSFNGEPVADSNSLRNRVANSQPGSEASLVIARNGKQETKRVVLAERPGTRMASKEGDDGTKGGRYGLAVAPLTPDMANQLGVKSKRGLVVRDVDPASPASEAGIRSGDVILEVNHRPVNDVSQFQDAMKANSDRPALLLVNRQGNDLFVALAPRRG